MKRNARIGQKVQTCNGKQGVVVQIVAPRPQFVVAFADGRRDFFFAADLKPATKGRK